MKQHKPWFDEECLGILDQRKQAKIQWIKIGRAFSSDRGGERRVQGFGGEI
jgi:hypothetical protein